MKNKRIITLTLNPAIDYIIKSENKLNDITNFNPKDKLIEVGGKGINASIIINQFEVNTLAMHYSGGFTGELIKDKLKENNIKQFQIKSSEDTRINLKLNFDNKNYEINSTANPLSKEAKKEIIEKIKTFKEGEILMIMGSYHENDEKFIIDISKEAKKNKLEIVFDLSKPIIKELLKFKPLIIKPNLEELNTIFNKEIKKEKDIILYMNLLKGFGAQNVAITLGKDGSYLLDKNNELYHSTIKPIELVSPQGSGDSFLSTFVVKYNEGSIEAFKWANAAGAATAQTKGLANINLITKSIKKVNIDKM